MKKCAQCGTCDSGDLIEVMCCEGGCIRGNANIADERTSKKLLQEVVNECDDLQRKD